MTKNSKKPYGSISISTIDQHLTPRCERRGKKRKGTPAKSGKKGALDKFISQRLGRRSDSKTIVCSEALLRLAAVMNARLLLLGVECAVTEDSVGIILVNRCSADLGAMIDIIRCMDEN